MLVNLDMAFTARPLPLLLGLLLASGLLLLPGAVLADSYNVNAAVPYPAPTQPATFDNGLDGSTVHNALLTLSGTCQQQNPNTTVSIWRNGTALGSGICSGSYSVQVMLVEGDNTLIARTANASQLFAPDSQPITITLDLPVDAPAPTPVSNPQAETPAQVTTNTNAAAASDLTATPTEPSSTLDTSNSVTMHVTVGGGQTPYTITLNWGDGSVETRTVSEPGVYDFTHTYESNGDYTVHGSIHDVLGAMTQFQYAVVTTQNAPTVVKALGKTSKPTTTHESTFHKLRPATAITGGALIAVAGYWFGAHHAAQVAEKVALRNYRYSRPRQYAAKAKPRKLRLKVGK